MTPLPNTDRHSMTKHTTRSEYLRRINLSIAFIHTHLDETMKLEQIATASHFSPYHFHRIFHAMIGETVNDYVQRKKMEKAAHILLCNLDLSITEIAANGGFSSSANFAKAFKNYFGVSPSELRNPQFDEDSKTGKIYRKYGKAFRVQDLYSQSVTNNHVFDAEKLKEILMEVKVENMPERTVAMLTAPKGYDLEAIFATWDKLGQWAAANNIDDYENKRYALCHDNPMVTPIDKCRYDACIEVDDSIDIATPFTKSSLPAGRYAVAHFKGDGDKVSHFYMELYSNWLPDSGFEPDNYPPVAHYLNDSRVDGYVEMDVFIKVSQLASS